MDSSITHNFIDPLTVQILWLKAIRVGVFEVMITDGERIAEEDCCKEKNDNSRS